MIAESLSAFAVELTARGLPDCALDFSNPQEFGWDNFEHLLAESVPAKLRTEQLKMAQRVSRELQEVGF